MNARTRTWNQRAIACITASALWLASSTAAAQSVSSREVLDLDEAAALLRVPPEVVRVLAESHRIPARRVGDVWRFGHAALLEWLKGEPVAGAGSPPAEHASNSGGTEMLPSELADVTARGLKPGPPASPAQPLQAGEPKTDSTATTVGERPSTPTSQEVALRDQRVLLGRGAATIDLGVSYGRSEQTLFPVIRAEENDIGVTGTLRYGLRNDLQLTVGVPAIWRRLTTFADATVSGSSAPTVTTTPERVAGDATISLLGVGWREAVGRPTVVWSLDGAMATGGGDRGAGGGLVVSKSYDPAVLFAGLTFLYGLRVNPSDPRWSLAKHNYGFQVGYTYAVNDNLALNTAFLGTYRNTRSPDGIAIPPAREYYALQMGTTWLLARSLFVEPSVAMRVGGDTPSLTVSLNFSHSLRGRSKP